MHHKISVQHIQDKFKKLTNSGLFLWYISEARTANQCNANTDDGSE